MNVALDTNAYTNLARGSQQVAILVARAQRTCIPFVVLGELRAGFAVGSKRAENERVLDLFLAKPGVQILFADLETITHYAAIFAQLRAAGKMIPVNDLWIASLVIQHGLQLCSQDAHFNHLPQVQRA